jgi:hypothetical protein
MAYGHRQNCLGLHRDLILVFADEVAGKTPCAEMFQHQMHWWGSWPRGPSRLRSGCLSTIERIAEGNRQCEHGLLGAD